MNRRPVASIAGVIVVCLVGGRATSPVLPVAAAPAQSGYRWDLVIDAAPYQGSSNFPVFVIGGEMWAFHPEGAWRSRDARSWTRSALPASGLNTAYQHYVPFDGAVYALGTMEGNYLNLRLHSRVARTRDLERWEVVAEQSNLPARVFYGAAVHRGRIWLMGGYDGHDYYNDVWTSTDAVHWTRLVDHAPWSPRNVGTVAVFRGRLWIVGGGVIDGQPEINPASTREVWSSADGATWTKAPDRTGSAWGGTPVVFDGRLWLIAANRNSTFAPALLVTDDGATWREESAPWAPRGAPAVWVFRDALYMTGGKYSVVENGAPRFIYRNDVWALRRAGVH